MQFHPLAYIVKLSIEMSMAELIAKVSCSSNNPGTLLLNTGETSSWLDDREFKRINSLTNRLPSNDKSTVRPKGSWSESSASFSSFNVARHHISPNDGEIMVNMKREVTLQVERRRSIAASLKEQKSIAESTSAFNDDGKFSRDRQEGEVMTGVERGMGVYTKVWAP